jgi:hypothetical protein
VRDGRSSPGQQIAVGAGALSLAMSKYDPALLEAARGGDKTAI